VRSEADKPDAADQAVDTPLDVRSLSRLKWRCRRGLLENDLFIERFFRHHEETITTRQAAGLQALMDLSDNDLLDLLLVRREPEGETRRPEVLEVLSLLRRQPPIRLERSAKKEP
jgi:antitoxin CptB